MAHVRKQVRDAARTRLEAIEGLTVPDNVAAHVVDTMLPAALLSTPDETVTAPGRDGVDAGPISLREITLVVVLVAEGDISEDDLDVLAVQVEAALSDDLDGIARFVPPVADFTYALERMSDEDGERWYAFAEMRFTFEATVVFGDPETVLTE